MTAVRVELLSDSPDFLIIRVCATPGQLTKLSGQLLVLATERVLRCLLDIALTS
jgi:hypothetical protein